MTIVHRALIALLALGLTLVAGCSKSPSPVATSTPAGKHEHHAPHGGTAVVLGNEAFHLELVRDAAAGRLTGYLLDGEMENFVRSRQPSFEVVAIVGTERRPLTFRAVANSATGEMVGDSSQFEVEADWLKSTGSFDGTLTSLEIKGTTFAGITFNFPRGNDPP